MSNGKLILKHSLKAGSSKIYKSLSIWCK